MRLDACTGNEPAVVVFDDTTQCPWLHPLARGFRHCFALVARGDGWLVCDPLKHRLEIAVFTPDPGFDPAGWYAGRGHAVLSGRVLPPADRGRPLPRLLTCVEIVKRLLNLDAPAVLTPHQLFRHLQRRVSPPFRPVASNMLDSVPE